jgi:small subunit ribosomal protein S4
MSKRINCKHKITRRYGVNLWGRSKAPVLKRSYRPGQHGQQKKKHSDYGLQLIAKQKLKGYYGNIGEKQFRKTYEEAVRRKGDSSENFIELLESRLDAVVYRMKFAPTVFAARQFVNHCHILVNGKRVNIPSFKVSVGDEISIRDRFKDNVVLLEATKSPEREIPDYMEVDYAKMKGLYKRVPGFNDVPYPVEMSPNLVIEFYSR